MFAVATLVVTLATQLSLRCICAGSETGPGKALEALGSVQRSAPERAASVQWDPSGSVLACQSAGRSIELFRSAASAHGVPSRAVATHRNCCKKSVGSIATCHGQQQSPSVLVLPKCRTLTHRPFLHCASWDAQALQHQVLSHASALALLLTAGCARMLRLRSTCGGDENGSGRRRPKRVRKTASSRRRSRMRWSWRQTCWTPCRCCMLAETLQRRHDKELLLWDWRGFEC